MIFRKKMALILGAFVLSFVFCAQARAMPIGTLLYRTSGDGMLYGYNTETLMTVKNKVLSNVYTGHVAMYVGQENGVDYIVEAMPNGIIKVPAKYFLNSRYGEKLIGAKIPKNISPAQQIKAVEIAKALAAANLGYDFDFKKQKGPRSGEWTCVGVAEKSYESANISNPLDLKQLEYNSKKYAVDITPDGFDNYSVVNQKTGDCLSRDFEFSKVEANTDTLVPLPEFFGFNSGVENNGERYFFFPLTQYYQDSLEDVEVDIQLESDFIGDEVRGKIPELAMIFKWSLINNPKSALVNLGKNIVAFFKGEEANVSDKNLVKNIIASSVQEFKDDNSISDEEREVVVSEFTKIKDAIEKNIDIAEKDILPEIFIDSSEESTSTLTLNELKKEEKEVELLSAVKIEAEEKTNTPLSLVIDKIYTTASDDYIEIYNFGDKAINLMESGVRLYKTKTSATPSLIMRIGNEGDGLYPGGVVVEPRSRYLIARASSSVEIKQKAQAIASRKEFTLMENGCTIYLSSGVVSSDSDIDVLDKVGYGEATYFEKKAASEILDNNVLLRKDGKDTGNNNLDFSLLSLITPTSTPVVNTPSTSGGSGSSSSGGGGGASNNTPVVTPTTTPATTTPVVTPTSTPTSTIDNLLPLVISEVYTTDSDDYVEIYNPNDEVINLKENGFRLYKAKASNPSLMMRIGNEEDGSYPGGFSIAAHGSYLITRNDASDDIKSLAQAISNRSEFTLTGDAYTVYLSSDTISSDGDEDIIDKVGYGEATYYFISPAEIILDNYILTRKANSSSTAVTMLPGGPDYSLGHLFNSFNNSFDFVLVDKNYDANNDDDFAETQAFCQNVFATSFKQDFSGFGLPAECYFKEPYLYISDIAYLWRLDECEGETAYNSISGVSVKHNSTWETGRFGCGLSQYYSQDYFISPLGSDFNEDNFTIMFYYKNLYNNSRPEIMLKNSQTDESIRIKLYADSTDFFNLPGAPARDYSLVWPNDEDWHLFAWIVNKAENFIALYRDGTEVYRLDMGVGRLIDIDTFGIKGDNNYNLIDEIAIFSRALSNREIMDYHALSLPLAQKNCDLLPPDFGNPYISWGLKTEEYSCSRFLGENSSTFPAVFGAEHKSMSFLWKNNTMKNDFNFSVSLLDSVGNNTFGLEFNNNNIYHFFDGWKYETGDKYNSYFSPNSDWHPVVLTYDPYVFRFNLYIDGNLVGSWRHFWQKDPDISSLKIISDSKDVEIKDIRVWNRCLSDDEVLLIK